METEIDVTAPSERVRLVRIRRPAKKNALTGAMYRAMADALTEAARDGVGAVVLAGSDGVFTAGNDLADFLAAAQAEGPREAPPARLFIEALAGCEIPLVAAVDGLAIGVGATLTLHCDLVYVTARATFRMPFVDLGLVPEAGSSYLLPRRVGPAKATEILMLGLPYDGAEAVRLGLANEVVDPDALVGRALEAAEALAAKPPGAIRATRRLLRGDRAALREAMRREFEAFDEGLRSPEARAAFERFLAKGTARA